MKKIILGLVVLSVLAAFSCQNGLTSQTPRQTPRAVEASKEGIPNNLPITEILSVNEYDVLCFRKNANDIEGGSWYPEDVHNVKQVEGGYYPGQSGNPSISAFVIDNDGNVFKGWTTTGTPIFGGWNAVDIATGGGKTYMTNTTGEVLEYNATVNAFQSFGSIPGEVITKIDVEKNGNIWVVTQSGKIYGYNGTLYEIFDASTGNAKDIGCGDGEIYAIIMDPYGVNNSKLMKYNWTTGAFEDEGRFAKAVDVARDGTVYVVTTMYGIDGKRPGSTTWESTDTGFIKYFSIGCSQ